MTAADALRKIDRVISQLERVDYGARSIQVLLFALPAIADALQAAEECVAARQRVIGGVDFNTDGFWLTFEDKLMPALAAVSAALQGKEPA